MQKDVKLDCLSESNAETWPAPIMIIFDRRQTSRAILPALLFSLAVHAVASVVLLNGSPRALIEPLRPLTVTLEALPPIIESAPEKVEHQPAKQETVRHSAPAPAVVPTHTPARVAISEERIETAAPAVVSAPAPASAPNVIARAPAAVSAPVRAEAIELPHFDVAYLNNPRPAYPPIARRLGLEGLVVLRVQVSAGGAPEQVAVARTSGAPMLDDAARKAVQGWTFVPARRGDTPIAHVVEVPIRFQLKN